ncbi:thioredoxin family protein [Archaeoglobus sp.]
MVNKAVFYAAAIISGVILAAAGNTLYYGSNHDINLQNAKIYFFYSDSCPHCREVKPYVKEFAEKHNLTWCNVAKMDSNCSKVAEELGIRYVPTLVVIDKETHVFIGSDEVMKAIEGLK